MFRRVDHPRSLAVELHFQVLFRRIRDRSANTLRRMIPGGDPYSVARRIRDRFDLARFVELIKVAVRVARPHPSTASDTTGRNLDKVNRICGPADSDDRPLPASLRRVFAPQDLCRTVGL